MVVSCPATCPDCVTLCGVSAPQPLPCTSATRGGGRGTPHSHFWCKTHRMAMRPPIFCPLHRCTSASSDGKGKKTCLQCPLFSKTGCPPQSHERTCRKQPAPNAPAARCILLLGLQLGNHHRLVHHRTKHISTAARQNRHMQSEGNASGIVARGLLGSAAYLAVPHCWAHPPPTPPGSYLCTVITPRGNAPAAVMGSSAAVARQPRPASSTRSVGQLSAELLQAGRQAGMLPASLPQPQRATTFRGCWRSNLPGIHRSWGALAAVMVVVPLVGLAGCSASLGCSARIFRRAYVGD
jgi:hypothetical protein